MRIVINGEREMEANFAGNSSIEDNLVIEFPNTYSFMDILLAFDGVERVELYNDDGIVVDETHRRVKNIVADLISKNTVTLFLIP